MKRIKIMSIIAMMLLTGSRMAAQTHTPVTTLQRPKLVVGIVVDQMRWDYLYRYQKRYTEGGFRRMLSEGYTCENTALPYVPSVTAHRPHLHLYRQRALHTRHCRQQLCERRAESLLY